MISFGKITLLKTHDYILHNVSEAELHTTLNIGNMQSMAQIFKHSVSNN